MRTCKSVSKQRTSTPFRINTYKKQGGGGVSLLSTVLVPRFLAKRGVESYPFIGAARPILPASSAGPALNSAKSGRRSRRLPPIAFFSSQHSPLAASVRYSYAAVHDLNYFRDHLDLFAEMAKRRGIPLDLDAFRTLDYERRDLITRTEFHKAQRNKASDEIARLKKEKQDAGALIAEMKQVSDRIKESDERIAQLDATQRDFLLTIPNLPHSSVPVGTGAADNKEVRRWGAPPNSIFLLSRIGKSANAPASSIL